MHTGELPFECEEEGCDYSAAERFVFNRHLNQGTASLRAEVDHVQMQVRV